MLKKIFCVVFLLAFLSEPFFSDDVASIAFVDGCKAYSDGDWTTAVFSLEKAASLGYITPEIYYMLINARIYNADFKGALDACEFYLEHFPHSLYETHVMYLKGRCLYSLGEYDKAVIVLSDFCHQNESHEMYASALFWIAESFYACYQYDDSVPLYERIVYEFMNDSKAPAAQYRLETISQRDREEKLLYLLKQTGEEYLASREEYEKQLRIGSPELTAASRRRLSDAHARNLDLQEKYSALEDEYNTLLFYDPDNMFDDEINLLRELKRKAAETKVLLDEKNKQQGEN